MLKSIAVVNRTTSIRDAEILQATGAIDVQIRRDLYPIWNVHGVPFLVKNEERLDAAVWRVYLWEGKVDPGFLGKHVTIGRDYRPEGHIFVDTILARKESWTVVLSHEILEMLTNEYLNLNIARNVNNECWLYPREICDPVQGCMYEIHGVKLSSFVYPEWYIEGSDGPFDHLRTLHSPFSIHSSGYTSVMKINTNSLPVWTNQYGATYPEWRRSSRQMSRKSRSVLCEK